ncbi:hypothetical protein ACFY1C_36025 [Streptomyces sp. NPDC001279]|uniref:hypothetical protein n=1 Tax=Streptomyces sp. NPDC001279 TaxID=3364556 RepID=UPI0036C05046
MNPTARPHERTPSRTTSQRNQPATRQALRINADEVPGGHLVALSRPVDLADGLIEYLR